MHFNLVPHPATPPSIPPFEIWASVEHAAAFGASATVNMWFGVRAPAARFVLPVSEEPGRRDGLWKATCFEAFLKREGADEYQEWNFATSGDWAAYGFAGYRDGMSALDVPAPPYVRLEDNLTWWTLGATIAVDAAQVWDLGLSAVIEEADGTKSYWALAHPRDQKLDFHHPDCFVARLP